MADTKTIVGLVDYIESVGVQPSDMGLEGRRQPTVHFADRQTAQLNPQDPMYDVHRDTLDTLTRLKKPAYVELSFGKLISDVLVPVVARVSSIDPLPAGQMHVRLDTSSARHTISSVERPLLTLLRQSLRDSTLLVVTADPVDHTIFDVRLAPPELAALSLCARPCETGPEVIDAISIVPRKRTISLFNGMKAQTCAIPPSIDCIPFRFPDSGCWVRAHRMSQLMADQDLIVGKLWIFGDLRVRTQNHPKCRVKWDWHVAPVVRVEGSNELCVIDPSIFHRPVSETTWTRAQGDMHATTAVTDASVFFLSKPQPGKEEDSVPEGRGETADFLEIYQQKLRRRVRMEGRPPYRCRPRFC